MDTLNENKKAVIYCRVSTREQVDEGNSLTTQERHCREYADKHGYQIDQIFIERGESAKTATRTELQKLMTYCSNKKNRLSAIIIYKIDRLSRNTDDYSYLRIFFKRYGVEIKSTSEYFENTPAGRFMENIIANVAQFDNDVRTERSMGGLKQAIIEGRYVWAAPPGYSNAKVNGKATITPNQHADVIRFAFEALAGSKLSVNEVRLLCAEKGLVQRNSGKPLAKSRFYGFLKNELYTGVIVKFGQRHQGAFEPIITPEVFNKVQRRFNSRLSERKYVVENPDFPLRRFVMSSEGEKVTGCWSQGRKKKYAYYRFIKSNVEYPKHVLEGKFLKYISNFSLPNKYFNFLLKVTSSSIKEKMKARKLHIQNAEQRKKHLLERRQLLIDKNLKGIIQDNILQEQLDLIQDELWKVDQLLTEKEEMISDSKLLTGFERLFVDPAGFWKNSPIEVKKALQWFEFPKGIVFDGVGFRTAEICSIFKLKDFFLTKMSRNVDYPELYFEPQDFAKYFNCLGKDFTQTWYELRRDLIQLQNILKHGKSQVQCSTS